MTNDEAHEALIAWISGVVTGETNVIASYQSGPEPQQPYIEVNFTGASPVREYERGTNYTPEDNTGELPDTAGEYPLVMARPVIDYEWRFSIHAYGPSPTDILRPVKAASRIVQMLESLEPLTIHETSEIRHIPDFVNQDWRPRAQMDIILRGTVFDGFEIVVIDDISFDIDRKEPNP